MSPFSQALYAKVLVSNLFRPYTCKKVWRLTVRWY